MPVSTNCRSFCRVGGDHLNGQQQKPRRSTGTVVKSQGFNDILSYRKSVCIRSASSNDYGSNDKNTSNESQEHHSDDRAETEDEDELIQELRQYMGRESTSQDKEHLDLLWSVSSSAMTKNAGRGFTKECSTCNGTGEIECQYCNGTGALTVGDMLFCDNTGCRQCPVCSGGTMKCTTCKGTGHYASWMIIR